MKPIFKRAAFGAASAIAIIAVGGCGGSDASSAPVVALPSPTPTPPPTPNPPTTFDFTAVTSAIENYNDDEDFAVLIGTVDGPVYTYNKGVFPLEAQYPVASASKWFTGATIMRLVDRGVMSLSDRPQDYLTFWSDDPMDPRSRVTLEQLLSFTAGFNQRPGTLNCTPAATVTVQQCAEQVFTNAIDTEPGSSYSYGPEHMQIAAAMAEVASGLSYSDLFNAEIAEPLGMSTASAFIRPTPRNPLASGGATSSARDYTLFLQAILREELVADTEVFLANRIANADIVFRPRGAEDFGDWHYALGAFVECDQPVFDASCADQATYSSPGSFGWTPWIDRKNGYWALIARRGERNSAPIAVGLQQQLQPLIEAALTQ